MHDAPQLDIDSLVALILLLDVLEQKVERLGLAQLARRRELLRKRKKLLVMAPIIEQLCPSSVSAHDARPSRRLPGSPIFPTNSTFIPSCTIFLPSRTLTVTWGRKRTSGCAQSRRGRETHLACDGVSVVVHRA